MKKLTSIILCLLLVFAFAACDNGSGNEETTTEKNTVTEEKTTEKTEATSDEETSEKTEETTVEGTTEKPTEKPTESDTEKPTDNKTDIETSDVLVFDANTPSEDKTLDLGYRWEKSSKTLTLSGMNLAFSGGIAIKIDLEEANVVIADDTENTIIVTGFVVEELGCFGIMSTGNLTFSGNGTLNVICGDFTSDVVDTGTTAWGFCAKEKTINIESGNINITCGTLDGNDANLRNIQGIRCQDLNVSGGSIVIETGDCYTTDTKGAFLNAIYVTGNYEQKGGYVSAKIGASYVMGEELFIENVALCADGCFTFVSGKIELQANSNNMSHAKALTAADIDFGDGVISAGNTSLAPDDYYEFQLFLRVEG